MPALNPFATRSPLPLRDAAMLGMELLPQLHASSSLAEKGRCTCGTRPIAVRLRMRSGQRPLFNGTWYCGRQCLADSVHAAIRREFRSGLLSESRMRHRIPLGLILQTRGVVTADEVRRALLLQEQTGERLGDVLVQHFRVDERRIAAALATQWNAPVWHLPAAPSQDLLNLAPISIFRRSGTLPFRLVGTRLSLASADGVDPTIALALERMHAVIVESGISPASSLNSAWSTLPSNSAPVAQEVPCADADEVARRVTKAVEMHQPVESRAVRVGRRLWLRLWLEPAALAGGPCHAHDILDFLFALPVA